MLATPKVSVCIPVYNCKEFIRESIDSVLLQTYRDFELIIADNASNDGTADIIKGYSDRRVKYYRNDTNIGLVKNWDKCLELSKGQYFKILPADDILLPGCLEEQVKVLDDNKNKNVVMAASSRVVIDGSGKKLFIRGLSKMTGVMRSADVLRKVVLSGGNLIGEPGGVLVLRDVAVKAGKFSDTATDIDFWSRVLESGDLYYSAEPLVKFRVSCVSLSVIDKMTQTKDFMKFIDRVASKGTVKLSPLELMAAKLSTTAVALLKRLFYLYVFRLPKR